MAATTASTLWPPTTIIIPEDEAPSEDHFDLGSGVGCPFEIRVFCRKQYIQTEIFGAVKGLGAYLLWLGGSYPNPLDFLMFVPLHDVLPAVLAGGAHKLAVRTLVWLIVRVGVHNPDVFLQNLVQPCPVFTEVTLERLGPVNCLHVAPQPSTASKQLVAGLARDGSKFGMRFHVGVEAVPLDSLKATLFTL